MSIPTPQNLVVLRSSDHTSALVIWDTLSGSVSPVTYEVYYSSVNGEHGFVLAGTVVDDGQDIQAFELDAILPEVAVVYVKVRAKVTSPVVAYSEYISAYGGF